VNLGHGQNRSLTAALLGGAALCLSRHPILAGILVGCPACKLHLALLALLALAAAALEQGLVGPEMM
jgi:hypothetical protein